MWFISEPGRAVVMVQPVPMPNSYAVIATCAVCTAAASNSSGSPPKCFTFTIGSDTYLASTALVYGTTLQTQEHQV